MPPTVEVTAPAPEPVFVTVSVVEDNEAGADVRAWLMETVQVPVPAQPAPDQPAKRRAGCGRGGERNRRALVVVVAAGGAAVDHADVGADSSVAEPLFATVSVWMATKLAVTFRAWLIVTVQVPAPEQPSPDQPAKREPAEAAAVSVTTVPPV